MNRALDRAFFARTAVVVAPQLLGAVLQCGETAVRIVEVEAYEPDDPASHSFIGVRPRNRVMFGPPGHLYVYRSYGVHWCANVVCGPVGVGAAVLLRAGEPSAGEALMRARRGLPPPRPTRQLCSGPGKLCEALGISGTDNGADLCDSRSSVVLAAPLGAPTSPDAIVRTTRIGITKAADLPYRWYERANPNVSRPAPERAVS